MCACVCVCMHVVTGEGMLDVCVVVCACVCMCEWIMSYAGTMYYAPTQNMKRAEDRPLAVCHCKENDQRTSNAKEKPGHVYVIQNYRKNETNCWLRTVELDLAACGFWLYLTQQLCMSFWPCNLQKTLWYNHCKKNEQFWPILVIPQYHTFFYIIGWFTMKAFSHDIYQCSGEFGM